LGCSLIHNNFGDLIMAQLKNFKDLKHKVVILFYDTEDQVKDLPDVLDLCLDNGVDFVVCDSIEEASVSMLNPNLIFLEEEFNVN
jgi:SpoU rRNA methylase family enzyme